MLRSASMEAVDVISGLDSRIEGHWNEEITTSRIKYGKNEVTNHNGHVVLRRLYHAFVNIFIITLGIIDILWMVLDPDIIYFVILTTLILVSGTMTFIQETRSGKAAEKLVSLVTTIITVRREDAEMEIDSRELVVGDIIILDTGDMVPADVRIIESNHLQVDQSALTGESGGVTKYADTKTNVANALGCDNLAFMGSNVIGGSAEAVVVSVGDETIFGSMAEKLTEKKPKTTYDKGSQAIVNVLLKLMFLMVPPVFIIMVVKGYFNAGAFTLEDDLLPDPGDRTDAGDAGHDSLHEPGERRRGDVQEQGHSEGCHRHTELRCHGRPVLRQDRYTDPEQDLRGDLQRRVREPQSFGGAPILP